MPFRLFIFATILAVTDSCVRVSERARRSACVVTNCCVFVRVISQPSRQGYDHTGDMGSWHPGIGHHTDDLGDRVEPPFEFCCITPTHQLFTGQTITPIPTQLTPTRASHTPTATAQHVHPATITPPHVMAPDVTNTSITNSGGSSNPGSSPSLRSSMGSEALVNPDSLGRSAPVEYGVGKRRRVQGSRLAGYGYDDGVERGRGAMHPPLGRLASGFEHVSPSCPSSFSRSFSLL